MLVLDYYYQWSRRFIPWLPEPKNKTIKRKNKEGKKFVPTFFLLSFSRTNFPFISILRLWYPGQEIYKTHLVFSLSQNPKVLVNMSTLNAPISAKKVFTFKLTIKVYTSKNLCSHWFGLSAYRYPRSYLITFWDTLGSTYDSIWVIWPLK